MASAPTTEPPESVQAPPDPPRYPDRRVVLTAAVCAAACLGVLLNHGLIQLRLVATSPDPGTDGGGGFSPAHQYAAPVAMTVALLVLRFFPRRGWSWLLLAGSVLSLPLPLSIMDNRLFDGWPTDPLTIGVTASVALVFIGVLGAAAWVGSMGAPGAGAALTGAATVMQLVGVLVLLLTIGGRSSTDIRWLFVALGALAIFGAVGAVATASAATRWPAPVGRPGWRLTVCGVLAALLPPVVIVFDWGWSLPVIGLALVVQGLIIAAVAGPRILLGALIVGMVGIGPQTSTTFGWIMVHANSALTLPAVLAGIAFGWLAGISRWRAWFGTAGLAVCALALFAAPNNITSAPRSGASTLALILMMIGIAAMVAAITSIVRIQTEPAEIPATFGTLAPVLQSGGGILVFYLGFDGPWGRQDLSVTTISAIIVLASAIMVAALAAWRYRHPRARPPSPDDDDPTIEFERDAVWFQLPPEEPSRPQ